MTENDPQQDLGFGASTFATDSANRRSLVPGYGRDTNRIVPGQVNLMPSYSELFEPAPTIEDFASAAVAPLRGAR